MDNINIKFGGGVENKKITFTKYKSSYFGIMIFVIRHESYMEQLLQFINTTNFASAYKKLFSNSAEVPVSIYPVFIAMDDTKK